MIAATAASMALIGARLLGGGDLGCVVDRASGTVSTFTGDVGAGRVSVYDRTTDCWVVGRCEDGEGPLWLYHQGTTGYLTLTPAGPGRLRGHDHTGHAAFEVLTSTAGDVVEVLDHGSGRRHDFLVHRADELAA